MVQFNGNFTSPEALTIAGTGVGGAGAVLGTGNATVTGNVNLDASATIANITPLMISGIRRVRPIPISLPPVDAPTPNRSVTLPRNLENTAHPESETDIPNPDVADQCTRDRTERFGRHPFERRVAHPKRRTFICRSSTTGRGRNRLRRHKTPRSMRGVLSTLCAIRDSNPEPAD